MVAKRRRIGRALLLTAGEEEVEMATELERSMINRRGGEAAARKSTTKAKRKTDEEDEAKYRALSAAGQARVATWAYRESWMVV